MAWERTIALINIREAAPAFIKLEKNLHQIPICKRYYISVDNCWKFDGNENWVVEENEKNGYLRLMKLDTISNTSLQHFGLQASPVDTPIRPLQGFLLHIIQVHHRTCPRIVQTIQEIQVFKLIHPDTIIVRPHTLRIRIDAAHCHAFFGNSLCHRQSCWTRPNHHEVDRGSF